MRKLVMTMLMVAAFALPTMAQFGNQQQPNDNQFRSTSTMVGTGSAYSANPTLAPDGTASYGAPSNPTVKPGEPFRTIEDTPDPFGSPDSPLGDAVLPLLLCAAAFAAFLALRRKREAKA